MEANEQNVTAAVTEEQNTQPAQIDQAALKARDRASVASAKNAEKENVQGGAPAQPADPSKGEDVAHREAIPQWVKDDILAPVTKRLDNIVARLKAHGINTEEY